MEETDGRLKVINSQVILTPPAEGGAYPQILPSKNLTIFINSLPVNEITTVMPNDNIMIKTDRQVIEEGTAEIKIINNGIEALLRVTKSKIADYEILDADDSSMLELQTKEIISQEDAFTEEDIYNLLAEKKVCCGINSDAIKAALQLNGEWVSAANGQHPKPGKDASLEIFFTDGSNKIQIDELDNIDYRDKGVITFVKQDTLLLKIIPAVNGDPGISVTGDPIPAPSPKKIFIKAGKNIYTSADGLQFFAAAMGQPILLSRQDNYWTLSINPVFILENDVDINSGHIKFDGDILIKGKVTETMEVHSGKNIKILGSVTDALIKAESSITIPNNVINSKILSGTKYFHNAQLSNLLINFETVLGSILQGYQQIKSMPSYENSRFGFILDLLVEKKYTNFPEQINSLLKELQQNTKKHFNDETIKIINSLEEQLSSFARLPYQEAGSAIELLKTVKQLKECVPAGTNQKGIIRINYCLNCELEASGSVIIDGQGCFHTNILANDTIEVNGVVRGGTLKAQNSVKLNQVGSTAAIMTKVSVPKDCEILINQAFENTIVSIGKRTHHFKTAERRVRIVFDKQTDKIKISHF